MGRRPGARRHQRQDLGPRARREEATARRRQHHRSPGPRRHRQRRRRPLRHPQRSGRHLRGALRDARLPPGDGAERGGVLGPHHLARCPARRGSGRDEGNRGERQAPGGGPQAHQQPGRGASRRDQEAPGPGPHRHREPAGRRGGRPHPRRTAGRGPVPGGRGHHQQPLRQQVHAQARPLLARGGAGDQRHLRRRVRAGDERSGERGAAPRHRPLPVGRRGLQRRVLLSRRPHPPDGVHDRRLPVRHQPAGLAARHPELPGQRQRTDRAAQDHVPGERPALPLGRLRAGPEPVHAVDRARHQRQGEGPDDLQGYAPRRRLRQRGAGLVTRVVGGGQAHQPLAPAHGARLPGDREPARVAAHRLGVSVRPGRASDHAHALGGARTRPHAHPEQHPLLQRQPAPELVRHPHLEVRGRLRRALRPGRAGETADRIGRGLVQPGRGLRALAADHQRGGRQGRVREPVAQGPAAQGGGGVLVAARELRLARGDRGPGLQHPATRERPAPAPRRAAVAPLHRGGLRAGGHRVERPAHPRRGALRVLQPARRAAQRPGEPGQQHPGERAPVPLGRGLAQDLAVAADRDLLPGDLARRAVLRLRPLQPAPRPGQDLRQCRLQPALGPAGQQQHRLRPHHGEPGHPARAHGAVPVRLQAVHHRRLRRGRHAVLQGHPRSAGRGVHQHLQRRPVRALDQRGLR